MNVKIAGGVIMKDNKFIKYFFKVVDTLLPNNDKWGNKFVLYIMPIFNMLGIYALCISPYILLTIIASIGLIMGNWCYYDRLHAQKE